MEDECLLSIKQNRDQAFQKNISNYRRLDP